MKKFFMTVLAVSMALIGKAQLVEIASVQRVATPDGFVSEIATISPDGAFAIVGNMSGKALTKVDLATGATSVVTNNGSANTVAISADGQNVVFRTTSFNKDHLRLSGLNSVNLASGSEKVLVKPSRHLSAGVGIDAAGVTAIENGKARVARFGSAKATATPVASINYGHLDITVNGQTTTIDPQGRGSYLWPSISPDGTKVVYWMVGAGAFVCNLDGSNPRSLGYLHAAKWLGNNLVVGMEDYDGEYDTESSAIVVCNLDGVRQTITPADQIALYPSANLAGNRIIYSTIDGALYIVNLK